MREARVLAHLLDRDDELARLNDGACIDGHPLVLHGRIRFTRDRCLVDGGIAADNAAVDNDLLARMRSDDVAGLDLLDRHLALHLAIDEPDIALVEGQQARDLRAGALGRIAREHLRTIRDGEQRQARFRLAGEHRGDDGRSRQCVGIRAVFLDHALHAVLDELARDGEHQQAAHDLHAPEELRRRALQDLHAGKAG